MTRKQILIIAGGVVAIIIVLLIFGLINSPRSEPVHLKIWGVYDDSSVFQEIIADYEKVNKHITITYQKKSFDNYEEELIDAFASDTGPNIWLIHNTWLPKHKNKIIGMPDEVSKDFSFNVFRETFVDTVEQDLTEDNKIYALPLYVDSLALFYNKDFFNSAGVSSPPETWDELINDLEKLIKRDQWGDIERAGVALGTAENINRSTDILNLLMLQNGTKMVSDDKKSAIFDKSVYLDGESYYSGKNAFQFYIDFSNPSKTTYTWNRQMPYSVDAFIEGKTAMMFNYSHHIATIKQRAPYLNLGIAPMPQIEDRGFDINYSNYWAFTVSNKVKPNTAIEAWKFILYLTQRENAWKYLEKTNRPTARKDLVDLQEKDLELGVFAKQSLSARNWYQVDSNAIETIFAQVIKSVVLGSATESRAIETAVDKINLLMK